MCQALGRAACSHRDTRGDANDHWKQWRQHGEQRH
jgi:hypothetical protein